MLTEASHRQLASNSDTAQQNRFRCSTLQIYPWKLNDYRKLDIFYGPHICQFFIFIYGKPNPFKHSHCSNPKCRSLCVCVCVVTG